jgi:hypothetical protein
VFMHLRVKTTMAKIAHFRLLLGKNKTIENSFTSIMTTELLYIICLILVHKKPQKSRFKATFFYHKS